MQLSKKSYGKKKASKDCSHWEGNSFCDCRTRNIRKWLGVKLYGQPERLNPEDETKLVFDSLNSTEMWRERSEEVAPPRNRS